MRKLTVLYPLAQRCEEQVLKLRLSICEHRLTILQKVKDLAIYLAENPGYYYFKCAWLFLPLSIVEMSEYPHEYFKFRSTKIAVDDLFSFNQYLPPVFSKDIQNKSLVQSVLHELSLAIDPTNQNIPETPEYEIFQQLFLSNFSPFDFKQVSVPQDIPKFMVSIIEWAEITSASEIYALQCACIRLVFDLNNFRDLYITSDSLQFGIHLQNLGQKQVDIVCPEPQIIIPLPKPEKSSFFSKFSHKKQKTSEASPKVVSNPQNSLMPSISLDATSKTVQQCFEEDELLKRAALELEGIIFDTNPLDAAARLSKIAIILSASIEGEDKSLDWLVYKWKLLLVGTNFPDIEGSIQLVFQNWGLLGKALSENSKAPHLALEELRKRMLSSYSFHD